MTTCFITICAHMQRNLFQRNLGTSNANLKVTIKRLIVVALLLAAVQVTAAQDSSGCTTLYHHGDRDIVLCYVTAGDTERFTRTYLTDSSASEETISQETYVRLMETDMKEEAEHTAQVVAADKKFADDMKAIADEATRKRKAAEQIHNKKECKAAGFIWLHGTWAAPGVCYAN